MRRLLPSGLFLAAALTVAPAAIAGPTEDAQAIIAATVTEDAMSGVMTVLGPMIAGAIESELRKNGIALSDTEAFTGILMEEFMAGYLDAMRGEMVKIYVEEFTPDELAGIAAFFATSAGRAMAAKTGTLAQRGAEVGAIVGQKAGLAVADRVAARLRAEGVTMTVDPAKQDQLLRLLDEMGGN